MRSECKIQRELDHPNIVKMIDAFETDNEVNIDGDTKFFHRSAGDFCGGVCPGRALSLV